MTKKYFHSKRVGTISVEKSGNSVTIESDRLMIESLNQGDLEATVQRFCDLLGDPENVKLLNNGKVFSELEATHRVHLNINSWNNGSHFGSFAIYLLPFKTFIGSLGFKHNSEEFKHVGEGHENVIELGYVLDKQYWGKGYGTEIAIMAKKYHKFLLQQNPEDLTVPREMVATVHPQNNASIKILEKALKLKDQAMITKFDGNQRLLFYKHVIESKIQTISEPSQSTEKTFKING